MATRRRRGQAAERGSVARRRCGACQGKALRYNLPGPVAQLLERSVPSREVAGWSPVGSTYKSPLCRGNTSDRSAILGVGSEPKLRGLRLSKRARPELGPPSNPWRAFFYLESGRSD